MPPRARNILAAALFAASIGLNAHTAYHALRGEPLAPVPAVEFISDASELAAAEHDLVGTYITGDRYGDRMIAIEADGRVTFYELGAAMSGVHETDQFRLGRVGKHLALVTRKFGVIEAVDLDHLNYHGDRYTRATTPPSPTDPVAPPASQRRAPRVAQG